MQSPPGIAADQKIALRIPEAVAVSGIGRSTIYELIRTGRLRTIKLGRCRLILRDDLLALLQGMRA